MQNPLRVASSSRVASGSRLKKQIRQAGGLVVHRIDQDNLRPVAFRLLQFGDQMHAADKDVLPPQEDRFRITDVEKVVAVEFAEVRHLRRLARAGANVAALHRHRPILLEEVVAHVFHHAQRPAATVLQNGRAARLFADIPHLVGHQVQRGFPRNRLKRVVLSLSPQRLGQPIGRVLSIKKPARAMAEESLRHRMRRVALQAHDSPILDGRDQAASVGAVASARGLDLGLCHFVSANSWRQRR